MLVPLINALIIIAVVALICGLVYWLLTVLPIPAPFDNIARIVLVVIFVLVAILVLLRVINIPIDIATPLWHWVAYA